MTTNKRPSFYKFYAIRKCEFLKAPAIFLDWDDCSGYLRDSTGEVEYRSFDVILHAMEYIYEAIKPPEQKQGENAATPSARSALDDSSSKQLRASGTTPECSTPGANAAATIPAATANLDNNQVESIDAWKKNQAEFNSWMSVPAAPVPAGIPPAGMTPFFPTQPTPMPMPYYPMMPQYPIKPTVLVPRNGPLPIMPRGPLPNGDMTDERKLQASGDIARPQPKRLKNFQERVNELKKRHEATGNFDYQKEEDEEMFNFVLEMRLQILYGNMKKSKAEQLQAIGFWQHVKEQGGLFDIEIKLLQEYHQKHGTFDFDENSSREDFRLKNFVERMKAEVYKYQSDQDQSSLSKDQFDRFQEMGFVQYVKDQESMLDRRIELLTEYHAKHGTFEVVHDGSNVDMKNLKNVVESLKKEVRKFKKRPRESTLGSERFARLQEIGFVRYVKEEVDQFDQKIKLLKEYHLKHGSFNVVNEDNNENDDNDGESPSKLNLAKFIQRMKWQVRKFQRNPEQSALTQERYDQLKEIGFTREVSVEGPWNEKFHRLKAHYDQHGNWDVEDRDLAGFRERMCRQMVKYEDNPISSCLNEEKYQLLKSIGLEPTKERRTANNWDEMFSLAQQHEADRASNPSTEVGDLRLRNWLRNQKLKLRKAAKGETVNLTSQQLARLATLCRNFGDYKSMEDRIQDYVTYKKTYGKEPPNDSSLSKWILKLKRKYMRGKLGEKTNLTQDQIDRLSAAGLEWPTEADIEAFQDREAPKIKVSWEDRFMELVEFKEEHGHCRVPQLSGDLGRWVNQQRKEYLKLKRGDKTPMNPERLAKLMEIGFVFSARQYRGRRVTNEDENSMDDSS